MESQNRRRGNKLVLVLLALTLRHRQVAARPTLCELAVT
jgi:hypothetical protein